MSTTSHPRGRHILGKERYDLAEKMRADYEAGASLRDLAKIYYRSYGFVHALLIEHGVGLRHRGSSRPKAAAKAAS